MVEDKITSRKEKWTKVVDIVTIIWLGIFMIGFFVTERIVHVCNILNVAILSVFVADLVIIYKSSSNWRMFLKKHWFDIIMVIPYFRIFRIFRIFKVLKILRVAKVARAAKAAKMATKSRPGGGGGDAGRGALSRAGREGLPDLLLADRPREAEIECRFLRSSSGSAPGCGA